MMLTPLEQDVLRAFEAEFGAVGFPALDRITATSREHTGAGRYTDLVGGAQILRDSPVTLSAVIQMEGLEGGLEALVHFNIGNLDCLELYLRGANGWDGVERPWNFVPWDEYYA